MAFQQCILRDVGAILELYYKSIIDDLVCVQPYIIPSHPKAELKTLSRA